MSPGPYDRQAVGVMGLQNFYGSGPAWNENLRNRAAMDRQIIESRKASKANGNLKMSVGRRIVGMGTLITTIGKAIIEAGYTISAGSTKN